MTVRYDYAAVRGGFYESLYRFLSGYALNRVAAAAKISYTHLADFRMQKGALRLGEIEPLCQHFGICVRRAGQPAEASPLKAVRPHLIKERLTLEELTVLLRVPGNCIDALAAMEMKGAAVGLDRILKHYGYEACDPAGLPLEHPGVRNFDHPIRYERSDALPELAIEPERLAC